MIKIVAIVSMLIDHVGAVFFPDVIAFRIIGRLAFPLFAYQVAIGLNHTSDTGRYFVRLFCFGLLAQLPSMVLFQTTELNVLFTLSFAVLLVYLFDLLRVKGQILQIIGSFIFLFLIDALSRSLGMNYGMFGVCLVLCFYICQCSYQESTCRIFSSIILFLMTYFSRDQFGDLQLFGVLAIPFFFVDSYKINVNKYFFYVFYPMHLLIIWIVKCVI